jgi:hypothetical protein
MNDFTVSEKVSDNTTLRVDGGATGRTDPEEYSG